MGCFSVCREKKGKLGGFDYCDNWSGSKLKEFCSLSVIWLSWERESYKFDRIEKLFWFIRIWCSDLLERVYRVIAISWYIAHLTVSTDFYAFLK